MKKIYVNQQKHSTEPFCYIQQLLSVRTKFVIFFIKIANYEEAALW